MQRIDDVITRKTSFSETIVSLCRFLRVRGMPLGPQDEVDALEALCVMPFDSRENLRLTLRTVLVKGRSDLLRFDELYGVYWQEYDRAKDSKIVQDEIETEQNESPSASPKPSLKSLQNWLYGNKVQDTEEMAAYSPAEVLTKRDFSTFSEDELQEVMNLIAVIARSLANRYNRRYEKRHHGRLDIKRTIRTNLRRGGEIFDLAFKRRKIHRFRLVVLCDVSKSMDLYSKFLIQFMYAFQTVFRQMETFVFSSKLYQITDLLQTDGLRSALDALERIPGWSGGTRIGESLREFNEVHSPRLIDDRTIVLILSDGWDTGETDVLAKNMAYLQKKAARTIWLNPLAGNPAFQPTVQGMAAAMPYIDVFAPAHNIDSLRQLVAVLSRSGKKRYY